MIEEIANAKINLYLDVLSKREDGYHEIRSVMHTVPFGDRITIGREDAGDERTVLFECPGVDVPPEKNLALRAVRAYTEAAKIERYRIRLTVEKKIPQGAGLGGGSADAGCVLRLLNRIFCALSDAEMNRVAVLLGADVPFCMTGGACLCEGIGERITPIAPLPDCHIVVAFGGEPVSTPFAYAEVDRLPPAAFVPPCEAVCSALENGDLAAVCGAIYNRFEDAILPLRPVPRELIRVLRESGASGAGMSGSGPAVFGIFGTKDAAEAAAAKIRALGYLAEC